MIEVKAHKQPGTGALIEGKHVGLENRNCIFQYKDILKTNPLLSKPHLLWSSVKNSNTGIRELHVAGVPGAGGYGSIFSVPEIFSQKHIDGEIL